MHRLPIALTVVAVLFASGYPESIEVPAGMSVIKPRSACPHCGVAIRARDNIPVVSWLALRGRCASCGAPISWRYPFVELLSQPSSVM